MNPLGMMLGGLMQSFAKSDGNFQQIADDFKNSGIDQKLKEAFKQPAPAKPK